MTQLPSRTAYGIKSWPDSGWWFERAEPSGSVFLCAFLEYRVVCIAGKPAPTPDRAEADVLDQGGSWLACDSGLTVGAPLKAKSPFKGKKDSYLYQMHHLNSQKRHFALLQCEMN
ncbi:hypothetical protein [Pseudomonas azadiae]|uniref:Uncharacterized protein n=1 Tax=Pseudomonas azadiae TaxID=2843612 RepID=A0ABS6NX15_9PSED|nr:hypothetical protein [Pseudomonas azadiae]MBV4452757.1 hypothetical protein [Pseudomonas azadiae]